MEKVVDRNSYVVVFFSRVLSIEFEEVKRPMPKSDILGILNHQT